jgi:hypothetical protein
VILKPTPAPVSITPEARTFNAVSEVQSHDPEEKRRRRVKTKKKRPINTRFRPGTTGACEAQLWTFTGPPGILADDNAPQVHWVAAELLDTALLFMRRRYDDFIIAEARLLGVIPLLSGSPLD